MLRNFRQVFKGNQTPMAVVMGVVLLGLVAYLAPSAGSAGAPDNVMARVYGRDILKRDMDQLIDQMVKSMGRNANLEAQLPMLQERALESLIQKELRHELADRHGIVVTDAEIRAALEARLRATPAFITETGQLRETSEINAVLREYGTSLKQWEQDVASELSLGKLVAQAASRVPVDEAWLEREHRARAEKLTIEAVTFTPDPAQVQDPGDAKLDAFLKASGARFQVGPRRVVDFVSVDQASLGLTPVDEAKVKALYETRRAQYTELKARHILFMVKGDAQAADALKKAQDLRAKIVAGLDFAKAAEASSEDPSAKGKGGDLGWFSPSRMDKAFAGAAAAMKVDELSQPVRSQFGYHLIKLEGRREKPFEEVKAELKDQMEREAFATRAKDKLEQLRKRAGDRGDLAAPARNLGLKVQTSKPFTVEDATIEGMPGSQFLAPEAFRLEVGQVSKVRMAGFAYVVYRVKEERPVAVPPLAEIRAKVLEGWKQEEARTAAMAKAQKAGADLASLGTPETKADVTINGLGELGQHPAIRKALLETPEGKTTQPLWSPEGKVWIARIKSRTAAEPMDFQARRALVGELQNQVAEKLLVAELMTLWQEGRLHPGFSSLYGRLNGIWRNDEMLKRIQGEMPDALPDFE